VFNEFTKYKELAVENVVENVVEKVEKKEVVEEKE
jgi:hypothetical protein